MAIILFKLPVPSTGFLEDASFQMLGGRTCCIACPINETIVLNLIFGEVEGFRCTYYKACSLDMIDAYDKVVDIGLSEWLRAIQTQLTTSGGNAVDLRHLQIYFDDGPCYEFICRSFHSEPPSFPIPPREPWL